MSIVKTIQEGGWHEFVRYSKHWSRINDPYSGFTFNCDENGRVYVDGMSEAGLKNLRECEAGTNGTVCDGIRKEEVRAKQVRIGLCECGTEVELDGFTNTCEGCNRDYNWAGQELAPRECWGEETGEHPADILMIP